MQQWIRDARRRRTGFVWPGPPHEPGHEIALDPRWNVYISVTNPGLGPVQLLYTSLG
jgi:hypothetical protein